MRDLMLLSLGAAILGIFFIAPIKATVKNPFFGDDQPPNADETYSLGSSPLFPYPSPSPLDENTSHSAHPSVSHSGTEQSINNALQPQSNDVLHKVVPDTSSLSKQAPLFHQWETPPITHTITKTLVPADGQTSEHMQQRKKRAKNEPQEFSAILAHDDVKQRVKDILFMRNTFDGKDRFYTIEEIANILHTEATLFNKPYTPPQPNALYQRILKDPELRELYEKRSRLIKDSQKEEKERSSVMEVSQNKRSCTKCESQTLIRYGFLRGSQRYRCKECGYNFTK